jgi:ERCC4-type nuclease
MKKDFYDLIAQQARIRRDKSRAAQVNTIAQEMEQNLKDKNPAAQQQMKDYDTVREYAKDTTPNISGRTAYQALNNYIAENPATATVAGVGAASLGTGAVMTAGAQQLMAVQENLQNSMKNEVKREAPLNS